MDLLDLSIDLNSVEPSSSSSTLPKTPTDKRRRSIKKNAPTTVESPSVPKFTEPDVIGSGKRQRIKNTRRFSPSPEVTKKMRTSIMSPAVPLKVPKLSEFGMKLRLLESRKPPTDFVLPKYTNMLPKTQKIEEEIRKRQMANSKQISAKSPSRTSQRKQATNNKSADLPSQSPPSSVDFVDEKTEKTAYNIQEEAVDDTETSKKPTRSRKSTISKVVEEKVEQNSPEKSTETKNDEATVKETARRSIRKSIVSEKSDDVKNGESSIKNKRSCRKGVTSVETKTAEAEVQNNHETNESDKNLEKLVDKTDETEEDASEKVKIDTEKPDKEDNAFLEESEKIVSEEQEVADTAQEKIERTRRRSSMKAFKEPTTAVTPDDELKKSTPKSTTESLKPAPYSAYAIRRRIAPKSSERRSLTRKVAVEVVDKEASVSEESTSNSEKKESSVEIEKEPEVKNEKEEKEEPSVEPKIEVESEEAISTNVEPESVKTVDPVLPPTNTQMSKTPSAHATSTPSTSTQAVRSSSRRSKPNRLYQEDFDVDPSYQKVLSSTIRRNNQGEESPVHPNLTLQEPSSSFSPNVSVTKPVPPPKPLFRYGCQRGYIPSKKEYIEGTVFENGKEESVNALVLGVLDKLMLDVCLDGVRKHSDISLDYRKTKAGRKEEEAEKRKRNEAMKKAKNQIPKPRNSSVPSSSSMMLTIDTEESTKRKRIPTKSSDDYLYDYSAGSDDKKMEERRNFLVEEFNQQMEQHILDERELQRSQIEENRKKQDKPRISLEEYMVQRNVQNRPDCGIKLFEDSKESTNTDNEDYFYHELLSDYPSTSSVQTGTDYDVDGRDDEEEEQIDIGQPESLDGAQLIESHVNMLLKCHGDSLAAADAIEKILSRPTNQDGTKYTLVNVMERAASEHTERNMRILVTVIEIINSQYLLETTPSSRTYNIESSLFNSTNLNAQHLKNAFTMPDKPHQEVVIWVHTFLVEHLPVHFLASYLVLLKHAKSMTCSYIGRIVKETHKESHEWRKVNSIIASHVSIKLRDPEEKFLDQTINRNSMSDVVFLLVSPMMSIGEFWNKPRAHELLFRWLKTIGHPDSEIIKTTLEQDYTASIAEFMCENITETICEKVRQKYRDNDNCRIVLVGYGWTTYAVHHIANLVNGISAIISLGFPVMCEYGRRGIPDDDILLTYCPTLFVVGAEGEYYDNVAMKDMRSSMINHTGLIVIGHANDQLLVPTNVLVRLGVTQKVVFRLILEKIVSFLKLEETKWERTKLFPMPLNNIVQIDASILKAGEKSAAAASQLTPQPNNASSLSLLASPKFPTSPPMPSPVGAGGRRNTVASGVSSNVVDDFPRQMAQPILPKKKKTELSQTSSAASTEARLKFHETLLKRVQMPESHSHRVAVDFSTSSQLKPTDIRERSLTLPTTTPIAHTTPSTSSSSHRHRMNLIPPSRFAGRLPSSSISTSVSRPSSTSQPQKKETTSSGLIDPASISLQ